MKLLSILKKDLLIIIRNKADMAVLFLLPLAFIIPISLALGSGDGYGIRSGNQMILLPVVNYDGGPRAQDLMVDLGKSLFLETMFTSEQVKNLNLQNEPTCAADAASPACFDTAAQAMLKNSRRTAVLIIPAGFTEAVDAGEQAAVDLLYDPGGDSTRLQQIEGVLKGAVIGMSIKNQVNDGLNQLSDLVMYAPDDIRQSFEAEASQPPPQDQQPAVNLRKISPENARLGGTPDTYQQTIPGYTVMYVFFIITSMTSSIRQEKRSGTFRRLVSAPISRAELLGGKLLASGLIGLLQVLLLFLVGAMLFGLGLGNDPLAFLLLTTALVVTAASLGLAVSATSVKGAVVIAPLIIAALIGGSMFPTDLMPPFLRSLSYLVPHSWAILGYQNLMVRGMGLQEILPQAGVLLGFALLFFLFAIWRFRFDD